MRRRRCCGTWPRTRGPGTSPSAPAYPIGCCPRLSPPTQVVGVTSWLARRSGAGQTTCPSSPAAGTRRSRCWRPVPRDCTSTSAPARRCCWPASSPTPARNRTRTCTATPTGGWYAMAAVQNAGLALDWVMTVLGLSWADLVAVLATPAPGRASRSCRSSPVARRAGPAGQSGRVARAGPGHDPRRPRTGGGGGAGVHGPAGRRAAARRPGVRGRGRLPHRRWRSGTGRAAAAGGRPRPGGAARRGAQLVGDRGRSAGGPGHRWCPRAAPSAGPGGEPRRAVALDEAYERWLSRVPVADV